MSKSKVHIQYNKMDIVNWFLINSKHVTPKKLQRLMYYAYAWGLVFFNEPEVKGNKYKVSNKVFDGKFEAWVQGAVDTELFKKYERYGSDEIPMPSPKIINKTKNKIKNKDYLDMLEQVNSVYGDFNGNELSRLNREETPWKNARGKAKPLDVIHRLISDEDMYTFYYGVSR